MKLPQLKLRTYTSEDLDAIHRMDEKCFVPAFRFSRESMQQFAETPGAFTPIAEIDGQLVGFAILHVQGEAGYIVTLDVDENFRRKGIAQVLMERIASHAKEAGLGVLFLHVYEQNQAAIAFYDHAGFEQVGEDDEFYGNGLNALIYRRVLS